MLLSGVILAQLVDVEAQALLARINGGEQVDGWDVSPDKGLRFSNRLYIPKACRAEDLDTLKPPHFSLSFSFCSLKPPPSSSPFSTALSHDRTQPSPSFSLTLHPPLSFPSS
ncbi:hypothetical protein Drorol1_Dr00026873, partial [Drosera rotundifolia]